MPSPTVNSAEPQPSAMNPAGNPLLTNTTAAIICCTTTSFRMAGHDGVTAVAVIVSASGASASRLQCVIIVIDSTTETAAEGEADTSILYVAAPLDVDACNCEIAHDADDVDPLQLALMVTSDAVMSWYSTCERKHRGTRRAEGCLPAADTASITIQMQPSASYMHPFPYISLPLRTTAQCLLRHTPLHPLPPHRTRPNTIRHTNTQSQRHTPTHTQNPHTHTQKTRTNAKPSHTRKTLTHT